MAKRQLLRKERIFECVLLSSFRVSQNSKSLRNTNVHGRRKRHFLSNFPTQTLSSLFGCEEDLYHHTGTPTHPSNSLWLNLTLVVTMPSFDSLYVKLLPSLLCENTIYRLSTLLCIKVTFSKFLLKKDRLCDSVRRSLPLLSY